MSTIQWWLSLGVRSVFVVEVKVALGVEEKHIKEMKEEEEKER